MTTKEKILALVECQPGCTVAEIAAASPEVPRRCISTEISLLRRQGKIRFGERVKYRGGPHQLYIEHLSAADLLRLAIEHLSFIDKEAEAASSFDGQLNTIAFRLAEVKRLLLIATSMTKETARLLADALGAEFVETP